MPKFESDTKPAAAVVEASKPEDTKRSANDPQLSTEGYATPAGGDVEAAVPKEKRVYSQSSDEDADMSDGVSTGDGVSTSNGDADMIDQDDDTSVEGTSSSDEEASSGDDVDMNDEDFEAGELMDVSEDEQELVPVKEDDHLLTTDGGSEGTWYVENVDDEDEIIMIEGHQPGNPDAKERFMYHARHPNDKDKVDENLKAVRDSGIVGRRAHVRSM